MFAVIFVSAFIAHSQGKILGLFDKDHGVSLVLTGDVMLGRTVMTKSLDLGDYSYPFRKVADFLKSADLVFVNLENPVIAGCPRHTDGMKFCADPKLVDGLKFAGIDIVTLANNHSRNYGMEGLDQTQTILEEGKIGVSGLGNLVVKEVDGQKFGFLGFDFTVRQPREEDYKLVSDSDSKVDILVLGIHWGVEYQDKPTAAQREWARKFVEAGADVIAGHHPHWVQSIESIGGKPVYYSLGNFVFDQMWSEKTRQGRVVRLTYKDGKLTKEEKFNTYMSSWAQPEIVE